MTQSAPRTYPCPACWATADLDRGCPRCGRPPDPDAAEVIRLDQVIAQLAAREQQWRRAHAAVAADLADTRSRRAALAARVSAADAAPPPAPTQPPSAPSAPSAPAPAPALAAATAVPGEVSTRTVQTILFILGGLLLGTGAVVFTAVAWTTFGLVGRAAILGAVTALVLTAPLVAVRRGLRGTAETFAVLGLLLVVLDGYAIWAVDLFGARGVAATTWTGLVCAAAVAVAAGYARGTRLAGPVYAAVLLIQPVLPLLAAEHRPGVTGWAYVWVGLAAVNLGARWWLRGTGQARQVLAWVMTGAALVLAAVVAVSAVLLAGTVVAAGVAGGALLAAVAVLAGVAWLTGADAWRATAAGVAVPAVALATGRVVVLAAPDYPLAASAGVVAVVATAAAATGRRWPRLLRGARIGGLVATGVVGMVLVAAALVQAGAAVGTAWLRSDPSGPFDWQVPVGLVLLTAALAALVPAAWREVAATGAALTALSVPASLGLVWWAPTVLDPVVVAALGVAAVQARRAGAAVVCAVAAAVLAGHALLVAAAAHTSTAAVLGALVLLGVALAVRAHRLRRSPGAAVRQAIGRAALLVGLLAVPGAVAATLAAAGADPVWPPRAALAATVPLLVAVAVTRRAAPGYLSTAAAAVHVATPVAIIGGLAEWAAAGRAVVGVYAGGALLVLVATAWLRRPAYPGWWLAARAPAAVVVLGAASAQIVVVLFGPYEWLGEIWRGTPPGSGVTATATWPDSGAAPVGLMLLTAAVALAGRALAGRWAVGLGAALLAAPVTLLVNLAQLNLGWPVVPATSLLLGLAVLLGGTLLGGTLLGGRLLGAALPGRASPGRTALVTGAAGGLVTAYGLLLAGAGLAGSLPTRWSTLAALAATLTVAVVIAVAGRALAARVAGWIAAVALAVLLAVAATRAADLPLATTGLVVLAAATVALATSGLRRPRRAEAAALEGAAHAAAVVALLLSIGALGRAAVVAALWGVALGLRALWPGEASAGRTGRVAVAVVAELLAWWLLMVSQEITTVEAYTLPAAFAAAGAGVLVLRSRPQVGSWVALSPALAAGFLPSLSATLVDPEPLRRLLLGGAAVAVVLLSAGRRWQAPVLTGGAVAVVVAVRELVLVWQLLDTWIPLTVAGLVLVGLAATYERRRRDLARVRESVRQMT